MYISTLVFLSFFLEGLHLLIAFIGAEQPTKEKMHIKMRFDLIVITLIKEIIASVKMSHNIKLLADINSQTFDT